MKNLFPLLLIFLIVAAPVRAQDDLDKLLTRHNSHSIPYISVQELKVLQQNEDIVLLDAREREEFEVSHIENAVFVGYSNFSAEGVSQKISDKNTTIIVYCSLGIRSETISEKLKKEGYSNVSNLYGGIFKWKNQQFPVVDSLGNETEKVHTFSRQWSKWLENGEKIY